MPALLTDDQAWPWGVGRGARPGSRDRGAPPRYVLYYLSYKYTRTTLRGSVPSIRLGIFPLSLFFIGLRIE